MIQNSCSGERYGPLVSNYEKRLKYKHNFGLIQTVKAYKSLEEKKSCFILINFDIHFDDRM